MTNRAARYLIIQRSMWSAFTLDIVDPSGRVVGGVRSPALFQFRNARLAFHPPGSTAGNVKFDFDKVAYDASVEVLRRGFINDVRYRLERDGSVLAAVDIVREPGKRFPAVMLQSSVQARLQRIGPPWRRRFELRQGEQPLATMLHPHRFTLRAQMAVDINTGQPVLPLVFAAYVIMELLY